jgi:hypothetical protein
VVRTHQSKKFASQELAELTQRGSKQVISLVMHVLTVSFKYLMFVIHKFYSTKNYWYAYFSINSRHPYIFLTRKSAKELRLMAKNLKLNDKK